VEKETADQITIRTYIDTLFESYRHASSIRHRTIDCKLDNLQDDIRELRGTKEELAAIKEATRLAKDVVDVRLASMNEFRSALSDQADSFLTRTEYQAQHQNLESRFTRMDEDIRMLRESRAELQGKASQSQVNVALMVAAIGIALSVLGLMLQGV
jgi:chaperonin cofactor prefoldin